MPSFLLLSDLNEKQIAQYRDYVRKAFPPITQASLVIQQNWPRLEQYFPETQLYMIDDSGDIMGLMNTIPLHWDQPMTELPDDGWDWMMTKGISDNKSNITSNTLGGLQVIIPKHNQGKGYSKLIIVQMKALVQVIGYKHFIIPIRPTFKPKHPEMDMAAYIKLKEGDKIYDPWIRTHVSSGAEIIKVCSNSMNVQGDLAFWKGIIGSKIEESGWYRVAGALNLVKIDVEGDRGEYREDNAWIRYEV